MLAGIDTLRNNTAMAAVMRGYHATLGAGWGDFNPGFPSDEGESGGGGGYNMPSTPASQPGTNWAQIIPAIGQAVGQSIAIARGKPVYAQSPSVLNRPQGQTQYTRDAQGNLRDVYGNLVQAGTGLTQGIGTFIKNNPTLVLAGAVGAFLLFREPPRRR